MKTLVCCLCLTAIATLPTPVLGKEPLRSPADGMRPRSSPRAAPLAPDLVENATPVTLAAAAADTFHLAWFDFQSDNLVPDPMGWTTVDKTAQAGDFFHVADATELDGGTFGSLLPLVGAQSMWCGVSDLGDPAFCSYQTLPGYGHSWTQFLTSQSISCDSARVSYKVRWDSEAIYDFTVAEYFDPSAGWVRLPVNGGDPFGYNDEGLLVETFAFSVAAGQTRIRFQFTSDPTFDDEDGLSPSDGAVLFDSITVECFNGGTLTSTRFEDFEDEAPGSNETDDGFWTGAGLPGFGDFGALYRTSQVVQEDPCLYLAAQAWGWFDSPFITNYSCGGFPAQGAMRFGPDIEGRYLNNEIWSPPIPFVGAGSEVRLSFRVYRDLPLDNLQFYLFRVRSYVGSCPGPWRDDNTPRFGGAKDWFVETASIGQFVEQGADSIQIAIRAVDLCNVWCGVLGSGSCHSHAPLVDEVHVVRINTTGPQFVVRHVDLFQDNFTEDGTSTGTARADEANDVAATINPNIIPGDSIVVTVDDPGDTIGTDPLSGVGPSVYVFASVRPPGQPGKAGRDIEAPETDVDVGKRFPLVDSLIHDGVRWYRYRMDHARSSGGAVIESRYCFDMNDVLFTPGDTISYVIAASNSAGEERYFSREAGGQGDNFVTGSLAAALASPMEFTILPAGGEILYVDDVDDRGGPVQLYFDTAFRLLGLEGRVDRFDVLDPTALAGNSPASRVTNLFLQLSQPYQTIIWSSGSLEQGLIGDGTGAPDKADDYGMLFEFLDTGGNNPGLYLTGDNIAAEWLTLSGASAINLRSAYANFNLISGDHSSVGEPLSPSLKATGSCFIHQGVPDSLIALGGCPLLGAFDVLQPTGPASSTEFPYPNGSGAAVTSHITPNGVGETARVILSGFSYHHIRDHTSAFPPARVEHLRDILVCLQNIVSPPVGIDDTPRPADALGNNYPNPFNPATTITYSISVTARVSLRVYDVAGRLVRILVDAEQSPRADGFTVTWDGTSEAGTPVSSGVYFYKLSTPRFSQTKKMVLLK